MSEKKKQPLLRSIYRDSLALLTDLYELTMAYSYWKEGMADREAVFQLFFRKKPFGGEYAVCAGIDVALEYIENFAMQPDDLAYLESLKDGVGDPLFEPAFLDYMAELKLELDVDAFEEGMPVFPTEPILRVKGPILQAQIIESAMLNIVNFQTLIATKASRVVAAADGDHVVEFGLRRAQGIDGAIAASRAAYIGGCDSTSNVMGGKLFGIPVMGTHAHSWVMAFDEEKEAFRAFAKAYPNNCVFLIDTYDSEKGVETAIELAKEGFKPRAVRLDSGNLLFLGGMVRKKLDDAGLGDIQIMATNELTEQTISELKRGGSKISIWGVGTNLVTAKDQPALDGVYKLSAVQDGKGEWLYKLKVSDEVLKTTHPGITQVRRFSSNGKDVADMMYDEGFGPGNVIIGPNSSVKVDPTWEHRDMLKPMLRGSKRVGKAPTMEEIRERGIEERKRVDEQPPFIGMEKALLEEKLRQIEEIT